MVMTSKNLRNKEEMLLILMKKIMRSTIVKMQMILMTKMKVHKRKEVEQNLGVSHQKKLKEKNWRISLTILQSMWMIAKKSNLMKKMTRWIWMMLEEVLKIKLHLNNSNSKLCLKLKNQDKMRMMMVTKTKMFQEPTIQLNMQISKFLKM